jgi:hypothetical protein
MNRLSEIRSVLWEERQKSSHDNDPLSFSKSILSPISKLTISPLDTDRSSEIANVLERRKNSHSNDSLSSLQSMPLAASKSIFQLVVSETSMEIPTLYNSNKYEDMPPLTISIDHRGRAVFTMKNGSKQDLKDILSVMENRVISIKSTFHNKLINILIDTKCDIIYVSSRITLHNEWKKVHNLKMHGFNREIIKCLTKANIKWKMDDISSIWKNAWILPTMTYDIINTNWIEK